MTKNKQTFSITGTAEILIPDKLGRTSYLVTLGLVAMMIAGIGAVYSRLPQSIPLYFSLPWGEARLAPKIMFMSLPAIALLLSMINLFLGRMSAKLSPILPRVLAVASVVVSAMLLFATLGIIQSLVL
jgi:hypothetical protein